MMLEMNKVRNAANAYYLLQSEPHSTVLPLEYQSERFKMNWNLYKGDSLSDDVKDDKFRL